MNGGFTLLEALVALLVLVIVATVVLETQVTTQAIEQAARAMQQVRREGPWYAVPDGPGLGIEVNEAALAAEAPLAIVSHLRRADGSLTNR